MQPTRAEQCLVGEAGLRADTHLFGEATNACQQHRVGVARTLDELEVVARVEPSARGVDPLPERVQIAVESARPGAVVGRPIGHRVRVVEVCRRGPERRAYEARPVALYLEEVHGPMQRRLVLHGGPTNQEGR